MKILNNLGNIITVFLIIFISIQSKILGQNQRFCDVIDTCYYNINHSVISKESTSINFMFSLLRNDTNSKSSIIVYEDNSFQSYGLLVNFFDFDTTLFICSKENNRTILLRLGSPFCDFSSEYDLINSKNINNIYVLDNNANFCYLLSFALDELQVASVFRKNTNGHTERYDIIDSYIFENSTLISKKTISDLYILLNHYDYRLQKDESWVLSDFSCANKYLKKIGKLCN